MYELSTRIKTFERRSIWYIWFWSILKNGIKPVSVQTENTLEENWVISWETKTSGDLECIKICITEQTEPYWDTEHNNPVGSILLSQIIMCGIATKWYRFQKNAWERSSSFLEDGDSIFIRNFHAPYYTVLQPKLQTWSKTSAQTQALYLMK